MKRLELTPSTTRERRKETSTNMQLLADVVVLQDIVIPLV